MTALAADPVDPPSDLVVAVLGAALVHGLVAWLVVTNFALPGPDLAALAPREEIIEADIIDARVLEAEARRLREQAEAEQRARNEAAAAAEAKRLELVRQAAEKEAAERRAREAAAAKAKAEAARTQREAAAQAQREKDAKALLDAEERRRKAENSGAMSAYVNALNAKVARNWIKPAVLPPNLDCVVRVEQLPTGDVIRATVTTCNGDAAVKRSIEDAVLKASPLPKPADRALYSRVIEFNFKPQEK